jgi:hypothetical protein
MLVGIAYIIVLSFNNFSIDSGNGGNNVKPNNDRERFRKIFGNDCVNFSIRKCEKILSRNLRFKV